MNQPTLFEDNIENVKNTDILLYALGDFQSRGMQLAERELPLDRLLGAFKRASEHFETAELSDEQIAAGLKKLGANVKKVPNFVAKHPYRITISAEGAKCAVLFYEEILKENQRRNL